MLYCIGGNNSGNKCAGDKTVSGVASYFGKSPTYIRPNYSGAVAEPIAPYPRPTGSPLIQYGSFGNGVRWVQYTLGVQLGYDIGSDGVDGDFGSATESAVRQFQSDYGLEIDGQVGSQTIAKIVEKVTEKLNPTPQGYIMSESEGAGQTLPDGDYYIFSLINSGYFLDIDGDAYPASPGTNVSMYTTDTLPPEFDAWTISYLGNGYYKIKQKGTNMCLDVSGGSCDRGTNVQVWTEHDDTPEQWSIIKTDNGYRIQARCSGYFLDVSGGGFEAGTNVQIWESNDSLAQTWNFVEFIEEPKTSVLKVDKNKIFTGNSITFTATSDTATGYTIGIDKDGERLITKEMPDGKLTLSFSEAGEYSAYVTSYNSRGYMDSERITFSVEILEVTLKCSEKYTIETDKDGQTYKSDDSDIAVVSKNGVITALSEGTTIIHVIDENSTISQIKVIVLSQRLLGDCNNNGEFTVADVVQLQKWLLAIPDVKLSCWQNADFNGDGIINVFDLCLMKRELIKKNSPDKSKMINSYRIYYAPDVGVSTWEEAQAYCESLGGHLATIGSAKENDTIFSLMKSQNVESAYFGLTDSENEGIWKWVNGKMSHIRIGTKMSQMEKTQMRTMLCSIL